MNNMLGRRTTLTFDH